MRKPLLILLVAELLVAIGVGQIAHLDRQEAARAFVEWRQNPTTQTRQAFVRERCITEIQRWVFSGGVFAVLAGVTVLVSRIRRGEPVASGDAGARTGQAPSSGGRRA